MTGTPRRPDGHDPHPPPRAVAQPGDASREGQTFDGEGWLARWASFVKLPHTVFALPFALVGVVLASRVRLPGVGEVGWVIVAFTAARFAAMAFNRLVDRDIDAINPRTRQRELPRGALSPAQARTSVALASLAFLGASWMLNPLCALLAPVALGWVLFYSYTKRFTRLSHLVLGLGLGIAPVGGYLAITGAWSEPWWLLPVLAGAVMTWVGGFDVLYALQDADFDRQHGLHSLPSTLGVPRALTIARVLHVGTVLLLALAGWATGGGVLYAARRGVLHHERRDQRDLLPLRPRRTHARPPVAGGAARSLTRPSGSVVVNSWWNCREGQDGADAACGRGARGGAGAPMPGDDRMTVSALCCTTRRRVRAAVILHAQRSCQQYAVPAVPCSRLPFPAVHRLFQAPEPERLEPGRA
ncbi:MAG: putative 4-hydroxybenzoate polyprenyltransferase [Gemmatimonadaceae bacterium]|nr:putative 4-hydroxybenzoate polyprenyltransferase [Gemmatimonadaceae bacterium]